MEPKAHGTYTLEWQGDILHAFPRGNFNEYGIIEMKKGILAQLEKRDKWVLFERPADQAGITPEAIQELIQAYTEYENRGCIMVVMEVPAIFGSTIKQQLEKASNMPLTYSTEPSELLTMAQDALKH